MRLTVARSDTSILGRWWWTVDHWTLAALLVLMAVGVVLILAAGGAAATRIGAPPGAFILRQLIWVPVGIAVMLAVSLLSPRGVLLLSLVGLCAALVLLAVTPEFGVEVKGARRWIALGPLALQPSEFIKPSLAVITAWLLARAKAEGRLRRQIFAAGLVGLAAALVIRQPDLGMTSVIVAVAIAQFFLAGLPATLMVAAGVAGVLGGIGAYFTFGHVQRRVDQFLDPGAGDGYQITVAMDAFQHGGLFGRGPGAGRIKEMLPDAHTDFIFAVAGEEFGLLVCLAIVVLFAFIVLRGFAKLLSEESLYILIAVAGLLSIFGLQAVINMASSLHLIPTKGMTLPFISYGGSSTLALSYGMGMLLALMRRRLDAEDLP